MVDESSPSVGSTSVILLGTRGRLVIPAEQCSRLNIKRGAPLLLRVTDSSAELIPLALVPRDQLWFYTDSIQESVSSAEEGFVAGSAAEIEYSPTLEARLSKLAKADPNAHGQVLEALKRLKIDPNSPALRLRPVEPHRRYLEARVGYSGALILRRVGERFAVITYVHHRVRARAERAVAAAI